MINLSFFVSYSASEVANNAKRNSGITVPVKIRSFAKKMDDTSKLKTVFNYVGVLHLSTTKFDTKNILCELLTGGSNRQQQLLSMHSECSFESMTHFLFYFFLVS
jgi:hypothetical protein